MADPGPKAAKAHATYQDVLDAPERQVAEIVDGELYLSPRPAGPHSRASSVLGYRLGPPFDLGEGGPGGWIIIFEPELHLGDDIVVPDLAGWRRERMGQVAPDAYFTIAPDWACEVLSRSTERLDRTRKLAVYAREGIGHVWLVHPLWRSIEVLRLHEGKWLAVATHVGDARARIEPFDAIELDLATLWRDLAPAPPTGSRASESGGEASYEGYEL
jgi:Uma2 family endonuclease